MKKTFFALLCYSFMFTILWSCNSESQQSNPLPAKDKFAERNNLVNPLDHIGIAHNAVLDAYMSKFIVSYNNNEWEGVNYPSQEFKQKFCNISNEAFLEVFPNSNSTPALHETVYNRLRIEEWLDNNPSNEIALATEVLDSLATEKDKDFTLNLLNEIYFAIYNTPNQSMIYLELERVVAKHEGIILSQNWNPNETFALGALAIAKYSTQFWKNYDFSRITHNSSGARIKIDGQSGCVVGADVAGYVIGGVSGVIVGTTAGWWTFGAGTVGGFLAGKAVGAISASGLAGMLWDIKESWGNFLGI